MATGDIVKFGRWNLGTSNFLYYEGNYIYSVNFNSNIKLESYDGEDALRWVECKINNRKCYILERNGFNDISFNEAKNYCNKTFIKDGEKFQFALLTKLQWETLPEEVYKKLYYPAYVSGQTDEYIFTSETTSGNNLSYGFVYGAYCEELNGQFKTSIIPKTELLNEDALNTRIKFIPILIQVNATPTVSGEDKNLGNKTNSFSVTYSVSDDDTGQELTVTEKLNGNIIRTIQNPTKGTTLTCSITEGLFASLSMGTTNTIEIEVTDGQATTYRRYTFVKTNSAPLIKYTGQTDLVQLTSKPTITYSVSDNEGDTITVTEKLNGEVIRQFTATSNTNYTITLTDEFWLTCGKNTNTIEISASDVNGGTSYKHITFKRQVNKVQITMKNPIETDVAATKIMVSPDWDKTGCTGKVEVCNNGFDASPTWEDMTTMAALNRPYVFTNKTKTAAKWGIKIRLTLTKNQGYTGEVAIYGFGGAYE